MLEIPSKLSSYGSLATELKEAKAPFLSRPCIGLAPGANGSPFLRPSGVVPVFLPYTTFEVIVSTDCVGRASRYAWCLRIIVMNDSTNSTAMLSTASSLLP
ncbi:hypothetical protein D3C74_342430 [compost metagenome]